MTRPTPPRLLACIGIACAGCATLLPTGQEQLPSHWHSYDEAKASIEAIVPGTTRAADLAAMGLDPYLDHNIQLLTYSDVVLRFPLGSGVTAEQLDTGLRECLAAGKSCTGYAITARDIQHDHTGPFLQDALGFKRVVETRGWTFNALVLLVDDRVVYTLYGGQPNLYSREVTRQPLGPAQNLGESIPMPSLR